ncbi:hypothetical protein [Streptomyces sp. WZ-12]|uniref:hypothetical protein n=1 Tax=Streptomyces sp. WZ-12 TaxID=3030210 RepID=UPI002381708C|nr:hypothetical protein [Streptomyces sp. WZ-12]
MTRPRTALLCCALALLAAGCGIRPTGVTDGGAAPSGVPQGMRIYFASDDGPRAVSRPGITLTGLNDAFKLLAVGPTAQERAGGLANLVPTGTRFTATASHGTVTINAPDHLGASPQDPATGQLVCTLARAEALLHGTPSDTVPVTIVSKAGRAGPYQCWQFRQH